MKASSAPLRQADLPACFWHSGRQRPLRSKSLTRTRTSGCTQRAVLAASARRAGSRRLIGVSKGKVSRPLATLPRAKRQRLQRASRNPQPALRMHLSPLAQPQLAKVGLISRASQTQTGQRQCTLFEPGAHQAGNAAALSTIAAHACVWLCTGITGGLAHGFAAVCLLRSQVAFQHTTLHCSICCRAADTIDDLVSWSYAPSAATVAEQRAAAATTLARERAAAQGKKRIVTAAEPGYEGLYAVDLRNEHVPVAAVSPADSWDWQERCAPIGWSTLDLACSIGYVQTG